MFTKEISMCFNLLLYDLIFRRVILNKPWSSGKCTRVRKANPNLTLCLWRDCITWLCNAYISFPFHDHNFKILRDFGKLGHLEGDVEILSHIA